MPDTETGRRPPHVGPVVTAGAGARVDTNADVATRLELAEALQLRKRAGVELDACVEQVAEIAGQLLSAQTDLLCGDTCGHRPVYFVTGGSIDVEACLRKNIEYRRVGRGLHRIAGGQAKGVRESQHGGRIGLQGLLVIDVNGRAESFGHGMSCREIEETGLNNGSHAREQMRFTRSGKRYPRFTRKWRIIQDR